MEDAMILNKASFERGFAHATVYKSEVRKYYSSCYVHAHIISYVYIFVGMYEVHMM